MDPAFKNPINTIRLSAENTREHNMQVAKACIILLENGVPFYTEVRLKCGLRPDILCPSHVKQIIEVLHSETPEMFVEKKFNKLPQELRGEYILLDSHEEWPERVIL